MDGENSYRVTATWQNKRRGVVSLKGIEPAIEFSTPPEFKGEAGFWTPEHFLVAAVGSCYVATFYAIAEMSKLEFSGLQLTVEGKLGKPEGKLRFTELLLKPTLTIAHGHDLDRANRLLEKAEHGCLIARSLICPVSLESSILTADEILAV